MRINADFSQRVLIRTQEQGWVPSPLPGVARRMLDRIGDEVARATSVVRYDPGSSFAPHVHGGGEEFLVLSGVFQDESGDFPAGSYVRNPPQSQHVPRSEPGCVILVKLWQFDPDDRSHVIIDTNKIGAVADAARPGVSVTPLFQDALETVAIEAWTPDTQAPLDCTGGAELFLLSGSLTESRETLGPETWLRLPDGVPAQLTAGPEGARFWIKRGHLAHAPRA
ncbi:MAG: cupin domain-containing protein [Pseudomonadota bacterium]